MIILFRLVVIDLNANGLVNGKKVTNQYAGFLANQTVQVNTHINKLFCLGIQIYFFLT
jgi:hypothetical protein